MLRAAGASCVMALTLAGCIAPVAGGGYAGLQGDALIVACAQDLGIGGEFAVESTEDGAGGTIDRLLPGGGVTQADADSVNACIRQGGAGPLPQSVDLPVVAGVGQTLETTRQSGAFKEVTYTYGTPPVDSVAVGVEVAAPVSGAAPLGRNIRMVRTDAFEMVGGTGYRPVYVPQKVLE